MSVLEFVRDTAPEEGCLMRHPLTKKMVFIQKNQTKKNSRNFLPCRVLQKENLSVAGEYETRNPSIYGNVIRSEMELTQSGEECRSLQTRR